MVLLSYTGNVGVIHVAAVCPLEEIIVTEDVNDPIHFFLGPCLTSGEADELWPWLRDWLGRSALCMAPVKFSVLS